MEHILNNFILPTYRTFNNIAIPVGILQSNIENLDSWLSRYFIGTHFKLTWNQIVFNNKPFYRWDCFNSKFINLKTKSINTFISSIKEYLLNDYYLYLFVNEKYIPNRLSFQKRNFIHDLCVYGFNDEKQFFLISAYNAEQQYAFEKISYQELYVAYKNFHLRIRQMEKIKWKNRAIIFKINFDYDFKDMSSSQLRTTLFKYCVSYKYASGIKIYDFLLKKTEQALKKTVGIDMHYFRILKEHIYAINKLKHPDINYDKNYMLSEGIFLKALKYTLNNNDDLLLLINQELLELRKNEIISLKKYAKKYFTNIQYKKFLIILKKFDY
ncbi:hypothetical protein [uncultured Eubacterium sp.]|uniref:hypothetical protein n=1 Tax=uncultured Eubacterium sp. TaxID=165185 RepID=UPI002585FA57|nr:hypothetical protein [uncultured Eubacterium sp.]